MESLFGGINKGDGIPQTEHLSVLSIGVDVRTYILDSRLYYGETKHISIGLPSPLNDSCAFKTLTTQLSVNDQASIQFQYEELAHNGTDWGDDGKMYITTTGDSTNTDENGNVVKCGVHELAVKYGWIKNEV